MKRHLDYRSPPRLRLVLLIAAAASGLSSAAAEAAGVEWAFKPSYFTHSATDGQRTIQYASAQKAYAQVENFRRSGYRQQRIRIHGAGGSADNIHLVETWGEGEWIRPYGEWLRPFRAGATPYGPWGNPQGPWTLPMESWVNPYGLGQLPHPPWQQWSVYAAPQPVYGNAAMCRPFHGMPSSGGGHGSGAPSSGRSEHGGQGHGGHGSGGPASGGSVPPQWQQP